MREVKSGWFVVGAVGLDVGVVVAAAAAAVGALHEYLGFEMRSRAKTCTLTFDGLLSALWEVRTQQNSVAHSVLDSVAMVQLTTRKMLHRSPYIRLKKVLTCNYRVIG